MEIANIIKKIRMEQLMSQQQFADAIGVSFATVNRWENGKAAPTFKAMQKIDAFCRENCPDIDIRIALED